VAEGQPGAETLGFAVDVADFDLLVLGDCNPDVMVTGDDLEPVFGQAELLVDEARLVVGGSGSITACGAARLGLRTAFISVVGDDVFGRFMLDALARRGVDVSGCVVDPERPTGLSMVLLRRGGTDRAILTAPGTTASLTMEAVDPDLIAAARHIHVSSYFLQEALRPDLSLLFDAARAAGLTTSVDPNWDPADAWDGGLRGLLARCDVFLPNAAEATRIAGGEPAAAASALATDGALVVVKVGEDGALAVLGDEVWSVPAPRVDTVDATGAGDSFDAGFLAGFLTGWSVPRAAALGCTCGALSTRALGGTAAQPTMEEALAVLEAPP
jgi:sugar/nucleoside kinase (ribokinase family)